MIYTKKGDDGTTSLVGGTRVKKCDLRVESYGTVDELNSHLGLCADLVKSISQEHSAQLKQIQWNLFVVQSLLACEDQATMDMMPQLPSDATAELERWIDSMEAQLPPMRAFIIPGGNQAGAQCHVARCVCRRAERCMVRLQEQCAVMPQLLGYLNRLSDYLFSLGRLVVVLDGQEECLWLPKKS